MDIRSFEAVGDIHFGDGREHVRNILKSGVKPFCKIPGDDETDAFDELALHVYYDADGAVEFVEAFEPAPVTFRDLTFWGRRLFDVDTDMRRLGFISTQTDVGCRYDDAGIALYAPDGHVEAVAAYRRGYYDD